MRLLAMLGIASAVTACGATPVGFAPVAHPSARSSEVAIALAINSATSSDDLIDIQLAIAREASAFGQVVIFVPGDGDRVTLEQQLSADAQLSKALSAGKLRVLTARFSGPWIRDYGPLSGSNGFVDAHYDDTSRRGDLEQLRQRLYEMALIKLGHADDGGSNEATGVLQKAELIDKLLLARVRPLDDDAPLSMLQATYSPQNFRYLAGDIELDGGNLLRLADGTCLTSTETVDKNHGHRAQVEPSYAASACATARCSCFRSRDRT